MYIFFAKNKFGKGHLYGTLLTSFFLNVLWTDAKWENEKFLVLFLFVTIIYIVLSALTWKTKDDRNSLAVIMATVSLFVLTSFKIQEYQKLNTHMLEFVVQGVAAMYISKFIKNRVQWIIGAVLFALGWVLIVQVEGEFDWLSIEHFTWIVLLGALVWMFKWKNDGFISKLPFYHRIIIILFTFSSLVYITTITNVLFTDSSQSITSIAVSISWLLYTFVFLAYGKIKKRSPYSVFGIIMLFIILLKVVFFDLSISSVAIRALLFLGLGSVGLIVSRIFYQSK